MIKNQKLIETLHILNKIFTLNKNVKKKAYEFILCDECGGYGCWSCDYNSGYTEVDYDLRDSEYARKTALIKQAINNIYRHRLPIKYGYRYNRYGERVIYFQYNDLQVSFHDPRRQIFCKRFRGDWISRKNTRIPFGFIYGAPYNFKNLKNK